MTGQQMEDTIYELLLDSKLSKMISGRVYKYGTRPRDSNKEDIVVRFVAGLTAQVQTGNVSVNIYVPDLARPNSPGVRDVRRCRTIEDEAASWVETLKNIPEYEIGLAQTITTNREDEIGQHFISVRINYQLIEINL